MKCSWRPDEGQSACASTADENSLNLCDDHMAEAIRRRKVKVEGWKAAAIEKDAERYAKLLDLHTAFDAGRDALLNHALEIGDIAGDSRVTVVHGRTNSVLFNVLTGSVKSSTLAVPGWKTVGHVKGVINEPIDDLSLEAARVYCDAFNKSLSKCDGTTAIVVYDHRSEVSHDAMRQVRLRRRVRS